MIVFGKEVRGMLVVSVMTMAAAGSISACAAFDPQGAAQQSAPNYYNTPYSSLSAEQKMASRIISPIRVIRPGVPARVWFRA